MRFSPLPLSMSTLVSRNSSTIGFKTKAAGARTNQALVSSSAVKVIAVSFQGFIAATWLTSVRSRSALLRRLFEEKVSKTVNTLRSLSSEEYFSGVVLVRMACSLLATCRSIQHAQRLCVGSEFGSVCIWQGLWSHSSRTVLCPIKGLIFLSVE